MDRTTPTCVADIAWDDWNPTELATLLFVIQNGRILLIRKKRGLAVLPYHAPFLQHTFLQNRAFYFALPEDFGQKSGAGQADGAAGDKAMKKTADRIISRLDERLKA